MCKKNEQGYVLLAVILWAGLLSTGLLWQLQLASLSSKELAVYLQRENQQWQRVYNSYKILPEVSSQLSAICNGQSLPTLSSDIAIELIDTHWLSLSQQLETFVKLSWIAEDGSYSTGLSVLWQCSFAGRTIKFSINQLSWIDLSAHESKKLYVEQNKASVLAGHFQ